ncbi:MAG: 3-methyl-2-oxobutanoate dehydrogenase subunit VorB [Lentisphaerae bacterium]|nr:3-methyl-2-oxobutanoate dehydrogenase subunit VorB [Lentisphaerota bacterium]
MVKFVKGNEAVVIGALYAGCDYYFGYPITPASEVAHAASAWFPAVGRGFLQAECETASINMVYGASAAGKQSMTASSGPGISLMQETLSYMAGAELPGVIVNVQRAGPGLGNIYPEQADYNQAVKGGGHGSYQCIVLAPGNVQEMCDLTMLAFELSFAYRNPAIVLTDAMLGQMMETLRLPAAERPRPETDAWAVSGTRATRKNLITSIYLDVAQEEAINRTLQEKYVRMQVEARAEPYRTDDAEVVVIAYGVSSRVARTAVDKLRADGVKAGLFRPITLAPFPESALCAVADGRKLLVVELSCGQFHNDVFFHLAKGLGRVADVGLLNRMGGGLIAVDEVVARVKEL